MSSSNNELENYGARRSEEDEHQAAVDLVPGEDAGHEEAPVAAGPAPIDKKKKQMILAGFGGGFVLLLGLVAANFLRSPQTPQSAQFQEYTPPAQAEPVQQMPNPGSPVAPLIGDTAQPTIPTAPQNAGLPPGLVPMGAPDQAAAQAPVSNALPPSMPVGPGAAQPEMQTAGNPPMAPSPVPSAAPVMPGAAPVIPGATMQAEAGPVAHPVAPVPTQAAIDASAAAVAASNTEIAKLKDENKDLSTEVSKLKREVSDLKRQLEKASRPVVASAPKPAAKPAAKRVEPAPSRPSELAGIVSQPGAKAVSKSARADFSIYAVTDGRVWVVGKDGERLGPLAIGSPLTDGTKITGIDVARGVVLTTAGEIH